MTWLATANRMSWICFSNFTST